MSTSDEIGQCDKQCSALWQTHFSKNFQEYEVPVQTVSLCRRHMASSCLIHKAQPMQHLSLLNGWDLSITYLSKSLTLPSLLIFWCQMSGFLNVSFTKSNFFFTLKWTFFRTLRLLVCLWFIWFNGWLFLCACCWVFFRGVLFVWVWLMLLLALFFFFLNTHNRTKFQLLPHFSSEDSYCVTSVFFFSL